MNKKTFLLITLFVLLVLVFLFAIIANLFRAPGEKGQQPPSQTTITQPPSSTQKNLRNFEIISVTPSVAGGGLLRIDQGLVFVFNKPVNPETFSYELNPPVPVVTELDSTATMFKIRGDPFWPDEGSFTLTIKSASQAQDQTVLGKDYILQFKTGIPEEM